MQAVVIYDSQFGNTEQVAEAIAQGIAEHGSVDVVPASEVLGRPPQRVDLVVVGGPTQRHGMSPRLRSLLDATAQDGFGSDRAATFDTRYRIAAFLSGSAASQAARRLRSTGCRLVAAPESFFVERDQAPKGEKRRHELEHLEPGELERATEWGRGLATASSRS
jgi:flavorubredoxin